MGEEPTDGSRGRVGWCLLCNYNQGNHGNQGMAQACLPSGGFVRKEFYSNVQYNLVA